MADEVPDPFSASPLDDLLASDLPYQPKPGDVSLFHEIGRFCGWPSREQKLARPIRAATIEWLAIALAQCSLRTIEEARTRLLEAIPAGSENVLDGGADFIFAVDQAASMLGCDPCAVVLRPSAIIN